MKKILYIVRKFLKIVFSIVFFLLAIGIYNNYSSKGVKINYIVSSDTNTSNNHAFSTYVTQEELDDFGFRYWDIDMDEIKDNLTMETFRQILKSKNTSNILKFMQDNNLSVDTPLHRGVTPLMYASFYNDESTAKELIRLGGNPNALDKYKLNPLSYAIENNATKTVKILLDNGVKFDEDRKIQSYLNTPDYDNIKAIKINGSSIDIVYKLNYGDREEYSKDKASPFAYILYNNYIEIATHILKSGWTSNKKEPKRVDSGYYSNLIYIPNYQPMLELMLKYNVPGQPTKEMMKEAYDRCYDDFKRMARYYIYYIYDMEYGIDKVKESRLISEYSKKKKYKKIGVSAEALIRDGIIVRVPIEPDPDTIKNYNYSLEFYKRHCADKDFNINNFITWRDKHEPDPFRKLFNWGEKPVDKNTTFADVKAYIDYMNEKKMRYKISSFKGRNPEKVFLKDKNMTYKDYLYVKLKNARTETEKEELQYDLKMK